MKKKANETLQKPLYREPIRNPKCMHNSRIVRNGLYECIKKCRWQERTEESVPHMRRRVRWHCTAGRCQLQLGVRRRLGRPDDCEPRAEPLAVAADPARRRGPRGPTRHAGGIRVRGGTRAAVNASIELASYLFIRGQWRKEEWCCAGRVNGTGRLCLVDRLGLV
jgi:hypothetical protein